MHIRSFVKIKPSCNCKIALSLTIIGKSCLCREHLTSEICLLTPFAKISEFTINHDNLVQYCLNMLDGLRN